MTKHICIVLLAIAICAPSVSRAQVVVSAPTTDTLLGDTIAEISELLSLEAMEASDIAATVSNLLAILRTANETLAVARQVKEAYEVLRDYSLEDLAQDALAGLVKAMPEVGEGLAEVQMLRDQALLTGEDFWSYRNIHDARMNGYLKGVAELGIKGTIYPSLFSSVGMDAEALTESDKLVAWHFARRGQTLRRAQRSAAKGYLAQKIDALVSQAEEGEQLDLQIEAAAAQAAIGSEGHLELLWAAKQEEIADGVRRQLAREAAEERERRALSDKADDIFQIGVIK